MNPPVPSVRRFAAFLTAAVGSMNVVSALFPPMHNRLEMLRDLVPLHFIRDAQTATVLVGFALILLADGLRKRRRRAMEIVLVLLAVSCVLNLTKGLDYEEAAISAGLALVLLSARRAFDINSRLPAPHHLLARVGAFALLYYAYILAGFVILRRAITPAPSLIGVSLEPFRMLVDTPMYHYATPQSQWFERSIICLGSAALLYVFAQLLRPFVPRRHATSAELDRVREIIRAWGGDTLSYFSLQDGRSYFFDERQEAVLSYRLWGNVALVGGDPVGAPHRIRPLVESFLDFARDNGIEVCFLGVDQRYLDLYASFGLRNLKIGEEAVIDLPGFDATALKRKVRRAARHIEELGIRAQTFRRDDIPEGVLAQMREISQQWVEARGGSERGFSMTLGRLPGPEDADCEVTVAMEGNRLWGYLCLAPIYAGSGWSLDAMRRRPESPNGLTEFLVINAANTYRDRGCETLSLNFATLSNSADDIDSQVVERTRRFLFEQLSSFYQLRSLYQFNNKFEPRWRSRYLSYGAMLAFPKVALAVMQSEDPVRLPSPAAIFRR